MNDTTTGERLVVSDEGDGGPYIIVPLDQLADVCRVLDASKVLYSVDEEAVSLEGEPLLSVINLGRGVDVAAVQRALDQRG
jgi:hypothetical protein